MALTGSCRSLGLAVTSERRLRTCGCRRRKRTGARTSSLLRNDLVGCLEPGRSRHPCPKQVKSCSKLGSATHKKNPTKYHKNPRIFCDFLWVLPNLGTHKFFQGEVDFCGFLWVILWNLVGFCGPQNFFVGFFTNNHSTNKKIFSIFLCFSTFFESSF